MNTNAWTTEWPKVAGLYWFYGWVWGKTEEAPELHLVRANTNGKGDWFYVREGNFFYKSEGAVGHFTPAVLPDLPQNRGLDKLLNCGNV